MTILKRIPNGCGAMVRVFVGLGMTMGLGFWIFRQGMSADFKGIEAPLLAINPTIAVFSVNLALAGYQASPYRQFYKSLSTNQLIASLFLILGSFVPVLSIVLKRDAASPLALGILPTIGVSSVLLLAVAKRETSGFTLLKRASGTKKIALHLKKKWEAALKKRAFLKSLPWDREPGRPTHEFDWNLSPDAIEADPFADTASIALVAIANNDLPVFERALMLYLKLMDSAERFKPAIKGEEDYWISSTIASMTRLGFDRIIQGCIDGDKTGIFVLRSMDRVGEYLLSKTKVQQQCSPNALCALGRLRVMAERAVEIGVSGGSARFLTVCRQAMCEGLTFLHDQEKDERRDYWEFAYSLNSFVHTMAGFGSQMIEKNKSSQFYLVMEALSWSGCYGVKYEHHEVTKECLRAFAQLGREARVAKLECHWDKCAVLPWQHVDEKIFGIVTWMTRLKPERQSAYLGLAQAAYSRLRGFETTVSFVNQNGKTAIAVETSETPARMNFADCSAGSRVLDYSDFSMLKDFDLIDTRGGEYLVRGVSVPIFPESEDVD